MIHLEGESFCDTTCIQLHHFDADDVDFLILSGGLKMEPDVDPPEPQTQWEEDIVDQVVAEFAAEREAELAHTAA
jgi:hypothetical protein